MAKRKSGKEKIGLLGVIAICVGGALILKRWKGQKESLAFLSYQVSKPKIRMSGLTPVLDLVVTVTNPNSAIVPVTGIFGEVNYNGSKIASFQNTSVINVSGNQSSQFNLTARLSTTAVVTNIINLFSNPSPSKKVEVNGMIQTGLFEQSFTQTISLA